MDTLDRFGAEWFVRPGDVVFDIGAFDGDTAAAYLERGAAAVYAFEPLARNRERMPRALVDDPRFLLLPYALAERDGRQDLIVPRRSDGAASLSRAFFDMTKRDAVDAGEVHAVEVRRLDDLGLPRASFWKIDVEGAELGVLRGAERTLRQSPPEALQVEIFLLDEAVYLETLTRLQRSFRHVWAIGVKAAGELVHYAITTETISSPQFHVDLANGGTPHYYASSRSFPEWHARAVG